MIEESLTSQFAAANAINTARYNNAEEKSLEHTKGKQGQCCRQRDLLGEKYGQ
jgi:hypothetical protein